MEGRTHRSTNRGGAHLKRPLSVATIIACKATGQHTLRPKSPHDKGLNRIIWLLSFFLDSYDPLFQPQQYSYWWYPNGYTTSTYWADTRQVDMGYKDHNGFNKLILCGNQIWINKYLGKGCFEIDNFLCWQDHGPKVLTLCIFVFLIKEKYMRCVSVVA